MTVLEDPDTPGDQKVTLSTGEGAPAIAGSRHISEIQQSFSTEHQLSANFSDKLASPSFRNRAREVFLACLDVWLEG
jgi:hypothetical protein